MTKVERGPTGTDGESPAQMARRVVMVTHGRLYSEKDRRAKKDAQETPAARNDQRETTTLGVQKDRLEAQRKCRRIQEAAARESAGACRPQRKPEVEMGPGARDTSALSRGVVGTYNSGKWSSSSWSELGVQNRK